VRNCSFGVSKRKARRVLAPHCPLSGVPDSIDVIIA